MPNPKRRHSAQRGAKRRTHYKAVAATISTDATTGESHLRHRAHWSEGKMYYRGKVVIDNATTETAETAE
ncbi:50S ribosomal protein L32 [Edaphocola aurantiacus]|jgi:large subunit ribosomal protein L32|uniref:50S ribosomal protein L32 n=1 Tax=Edaphocola aurantiacus TaxID=2601682 RepID=UPI001C97D502|nr:50S ribosomal protein L32 [Edaphocola aurantiacus]